MIGKTNRRLVLLDKETVTALAAAVAILMDSHEDGGAASLGVALVTLTDNLAIDDVVVTEDSGLDLLAGVLRLLGGWNRPSSCASWQRHLCSKSETSGEGKASGGAKA